MRAAAAARETGGAVGSGDRDSDKLTTPPLSNPPLPSPPLTFAAWPRPLSTPRRLGAPRPRAGRGRPGRSASVPPRAPPPRVSSSRSAITQRAAEAATSRGDVGHEVLGRLGRHPQGPRAWAAPVRRRAPGDRDRVPSRRTIWKSRPGSRSPWARSSTRRHGGLLVAGDERVRERPCLALRRGALDAELRQADVAPCPSSSASVSSSRRSRCWRSPTWAMSGGAAPGRARTELTGPRLHPAGSSQGFTAASSATTPPAASTASRSRRGPCSAPPRGRTGRA